MVTYGIKQLLFILTTEWRLEDREKVTNIISNNLHTLRSIDSHYVYTHLFLTQSH